MILKKCLFLAVLLYVAQIVCSLVLMAVFHQKHIYAEHSIEIEINTPSPWEVILIPGLGLFYSILAPCSFFISEELTVHYKNWTNYLASDGLHSVRWKKIHIFENVDSIFFFEEDLDNYIFKIDKKNGHLSLGACY